ncbi:P-loop NTPase fold protein [Novosphingobium sp. ST904]|nr:P-loop NTPase fold protein [Novosphingobium sp. ST904]
MTISVEQSNAAALAYLEEYCSPERKLDFAVMLDGPWGSGKTFFVKEFLKSRPKHLYVSLYGISDVRQIDEEFYRQLHPVLSSRGMRVLGAVGKAVLKGTLKFDFDGDDKDDGSINASLPEIDLAAGLSDPRERLLIFDDLERCSLPVSQVLGYINAFVEHDGLKAIIVANETEILNKKDERYAEIKEKLIGQTLRISATVEAAYDTFLENITNIQVKAFLRHNREKVIGIHKQSETNNLRLLKQALWDYERMAAHLPENHWLKEDAMLALMSVVLALSIEHRAGRLLEAKQIEKLISGGLLRAMQRRESEQKSVEDQVDDRYPQINFEDSVLGSQVIIDVVLNGRVEPKVIAAALATSRHFANPEALPLWQRAWDLFEATDDEAQHVVVEFKKAFDERQFTEPGVIFHAFGILLRYARVQLLSLTPDEALAECKAYVDDLVTHSRISVADDEPSLFDFGGSFNHHAFMERETPEFEEAVDHYEAAATQIAQSRFPDKARNLLDSLAAGSDDFVLDLCPNNVRASRYYDKPVLASIPPDEFVGRILQLRPGLQRRATETLKTRHQFASSDELLSSEKGWLQEVRDLLKAEATKALPLTRERLNYMVESHLDPVLVRWKRAEGKSSVE